MISRAEPVAAVWRTGHAAPAVRLKVVGKE
jgi:hypothetical protein